MIKYANVQNATKLKALIEVSVTVIKIKYGTQKYFSFSNSLPSNFKVAVAKKGRIK